MKPLTLENDIAELRPRAAVSPVPAGRPAADAIVRVDGVSKRFCRSLKRSLWYGVRDIGSELLPWSRKQDDVAAALRPAEFWAVDDVSFSLRRGECLGLIGHNGAGKTTLLKMLTGLIKLDRGRIEMHGRTGALIALGAGFNPLLTGRENIYVNGAVLGLKKRDVDAKFDEIVDFAELSEFIDSPVRNYSSGMNVRLGFAAAAVLIEPDVLFLDEVLSVGDVGFRFKCLAVVERLMRNSAVVLVSHDLGHVQRICTSVMLLKRGRIAYHGDNIATGIQRYQESLQTKEAPRVAGTGGATVGHVTLESASSRRVNEAGLPVITHGEDLLVSMDLSLASEVPAVSITIVLLDQAGVPVAQCNSIDRGFFVRNSGKPVRVSMHFPKLPLSPAIYRLWITVVHRDRVEPLAVQYGLSPFQVVGDYVGYIAYLPEVDWRVDPIA